MIQVIPVLFRGIGQVMLQGNAVSGLLMLVAICCHSWQAGLLALGGCVVGTATARLLRYDAATIDQGLYGFNATLVGLAAGVYLQLSPLSLLVAALFAALSAVVTRLFFLQRRVPAFTAPFILCTWAMLALCAWLLPEMLLTSAPAVPSAAPIDVVQAVGMSVGQVMFRAGTGTGLLFLMAVLVNSWPSALFALLGAFVSLPVALLMGCEAETVNMGLMGYNAVLCAIALGGPGKSDVLWAAVASVLSVVLQWAGMAWGVVTLTAPFVVSVWMVAFLRKFIHKVGTCLLFRGYNPRARR